MSQELILLRHGKSNWKVNTDDFHRPLNKRGLSGAKQVGFWLKKQDLIPDIIITSPAERAFDTAKKACEKMGLDVQCIQPDQRLYLADLKTLLRNISELTDDVKRVLLIGHNPGLEQLLIHLSEKKIKMPEDYKLMPTATLARLIIPIPWDNIEKNCAELQEIKRPDK
jgi:phosphohistidine phosphatase